MNDTSLFALRDLPIKAIPFVIFLASTSVFGELFIRIPTDTSIQNGISFTMGGFTVVSALMFFAKVIFNFPKLRGLELD